MKTNASFLAVGVFFAALANCLGQTNVHRFGAIMALPDQTITLELLGKVPTAFRPYFDIYALEASTDLVNWTSLPTLLRTNNSTNALVSTDNAANSGTRFYRTFTNHLITPFPKPTGPYAVGTFSQLVTDPSRTNRYNMRTNSSFMVTFWYPAEAKGGVLPDAYVEKKLPMVTNPLLDYSPFANPSIVAQFVSHAFLGVQMATNLVSYPVVIYSHAFTGTRQENTDKALELASHGYVVVAMDHMDVFASIFPGGKIVPGAAHFDLNLAYLKPILQDRIKDIQFILDELARVNSSDSLLAGRLDLGHVGVVGCSLGGGTVGEACRIDGRCKALVLLDGYLDPAIDLKQFGLQKPFLSMNSTINPALEIPGFTGWLVDSKALFAQATNDAFWYQVQGSAHGSFFDEGSLITDATSSDYPTTASRRQSLVIRACMVSFFDKYLKNHDDHLLDNPRAVYPEVINFMKK